MVVGIVFFRDHTKYLSRIVDELVAKEWDVVVWNNTNLHLNLSGAEVIGFGRNLGSSGGFLHLLKYIENNYSDFVVLLDDDNALKGDVEMAQLRIDSIGYIHRNDKNAYTKQFVEDFSIYGSKSSFLGKGIGAGLMRNGPLLFPYGGLVFHSERLKEWKIYPDESYYLYSDDHDWTMRLGFSGVSFYLLENTSIEDLETSWNSSKGGFLSGLVANSRSPRLYYAIRNRVLLERKVTHGLFSMALYVINFSIISTLLILILIYKRKNPKLLVTALYDGILGKTGKHEDLRH